MARHVPGHAARFEKRLVAPVLELGQRQFVFAGVARDGRGFVDLQAHVPAAPTRAIDDRAFAFTELVGDFEIRVLRVLEFDLEAFRSVCPDSASTTHLSDNQRRTAMILSTRRPASSNSAVMLFTDTRSKAACQAHARDSRHTP